MDDLLLVKGLRNIWDILTVDDQINYQKSEIGKPKNPVIAK